MDRAVCAKCGQTEEAPSASRPGTGEIHPLPPAASLAQPEFPAPPRRLPRNPSPRPATRLSTPANGSALIAASLTADRNLDSPRARRRNAAARVHTAVSEGLFSSLSRTPAERNAAGGNRGRSSARHAQIKNIKEIKGRGNHELVATHGLKPLETNGAAERELSAPLQKSPRA